MYFFPLMQPSLDAPIGNQMDLFKLCNKYSKNITKTRLHKYIENFTSKNWKFSHKKLNFSYFCSKHTSQKHTYIILTPLNLCSKTGVSRGIHYFCYFCSKNIDEAVLTSTHNLCFEQKHENIRIFYVKNCHILVVKFSVYLNRHVFVM